jgi:hypothetical protein
MSGITKLAPKGFLVRFLGKDNTFELTIYIIAMDEDEAHEKIKKLISNPNAVYELTELDTLSVRERGK